MWDCVYRFLAVVDAGVEAAGAAMRPAHTRALDNISASESMPGNGCSLSQWGQVCNNLPRSKNGFFFTQGNRSHGSIQAQIVFLLEPQA